MPALVSGEVKPAPGGEDRASCNRHLRTAWVCAATCTSTSSTARRCRQPARRSGGAPAGRLHAAGLRCRADRALSGALLLHGYTGDARGAGRGAPVGSQRRAMDRPADRAKTMPPAMLAIVDGFTRLGGSQYVDSIHNGDYATYTVRDVVGHVDCALSHDRARRRPRGPRQIVGRFRRAASDDGASRRLLRRSPRTAATRTFATRSRSSFPSVQRTLERHGVRHRGVRRGVRERRHKRAAASTTTMEMLGYAAAYSPRSATAFDLDLPFDARHRRAATKTSSRAGSPSTRPSASRDGARR